jgi:hypothetical protein
VLILLSVHYHNRVYGIEWHLLEVLKNGHSLHGNLYGARSFWRNLEP